MRRIVTLLIGLFLVLGAGLRAAPPRHLRVGCDQDFPPYEYVDASGRPAGFNVDLVRALAEEAGLSVEIRSGSWAELRAAFERRELDLLTGMYATEERARHQLFSVPHNLVTYAIFTRTEGPELRGEADLSGLRILVQQGDVSEEHLRAMGLDPIGVPNPGDALQALASGRGDCAVLGRATGLYLMHHLGLKGLKRMGAPFLPQKYCFAVHKDQAELLALLNEGLFVLKETGRYAELSARHFDALESRELPFRVVLKRALLVILPVLALLLAMSIWSWSLRRLVTQRTRALRHELQERERAEAALRESEERFRALVDHTTDHLFWLKVLEGPAFEIEGANPALARALQNTPEGLAGRNVEDLLPEAMVTPILAHYRRCLDLGRPITYEETAQLPSGTRTFETLLVPIRDADGRITRLVGTARDLTEAKQGEEALRQGQKLESLGLLAGGIAHDFNNLLTAVLGNLNLAQGDLAPDAPAHGPLASAERTLLKAAELTRQMLAYAGRGRVLVRVLNLNEVVREMSALLQVSTSKRAQLHLDLEEDLPAVEVDTAQIQQVILNLVTNASDALQDRDGHIILRTRVERLEEGSSQGMVCTPAKPGLHVVLEVSDSGEGIAPEHLPRIFDPFFTTKRSGRGLGLSALLGIVRGHGGGLRLESQPGRGTTFQVYLPASPKHLQAPSASPREPAVPAGRRVLLVDDDPVVRESSEGLLQALGYVTTSACDGLEAMEIFQRAQGAFDLVLLDLSMPRMDGRETLAALRLEAPTLPVVLCSGYTEHELGREYAADARVHFLHKPFRLSELRRTLAEALIR